VLVLFNTHVATWENSAGTVATSKDGLSQQVMLFHGDFLKAIGLAPLRPKIRFKVLVGKKLTEFSFFDAK
jgi:hypothetical protein